MKKRLVSVLLLLSLSAASLLTACGSEDGEPVDTTTAATDTTTAEPALPAGLEQADYEGAGFNILAREWGLYNNYFFAEEQTGDVMDDAIYNRDKTVEEYLNIDITYEYTELEINNAVQNAVMSGDDIYQLALTHCISGIAMMVEEGLLYDFNDFEYVNLSADYWNHNANERLSVNGKQFYAISDYMIADPNALLFNKGLLEEFKLENPYDIVRSGEWTLDKMMEMASAATRDLDGNSTYDYKDQYGYAMSSDWHFNSFYYSSGIYLVDKDSNGKFQLALGGERTTRLMEKMYELINSPDSYIWKHDVPTEERLTIDTGRVLFCETSLNVLNEFRDTDVEYGILPLPKLDASQETYTVNDWSGMMCVPVTVENPEMIGKAIELLSYYSTTTTLPTYFDIVLGVKLSRDEDSREMLELIFDNIVFDAGMNYFGFNEPMMKLFYAIDMHIYKNNTSDFASYYATYEQAAITAIEEFNEAAALLK
ncbi:MAG: hypothetical protein IJ493_05620 [Clostridia bacterium]|nr:hypothetical protein [Clostridia bacterium]